MAMGLHRGYAVERGGRERRGASQLTMVSDDSPITMAPGWLLRVFFNGDGMLTLYFNFFFQNFFSFSI